MERYPVTRVHSEIRQPACETGDFGLEALEAQRTDGVLSRRSVGGLPCSLEDELEDIHRLQPRRHERSLSS